MLTRVSNITSYEHTKSSTGRVTTLCFHWKGEYYSARTFGWLTPTQVEEQEERFIERRLSRHA